MFFGRAAAAQSEGFRPCRRCRPEAAPGTPAWQGTSSTVARALRLIEDGALDDGALDELAARLGVGSRYLRRLFTEQLGVTPSAIAATRRVHFAKRLIESTALPMNQVALAAGYRNVRRFNAAVRSTFDRTPSEIRKRARTPRDDGTIALRLPYRAPLDWAVLLEFLALRAIPGVEQVDGDTYRRTFSLGASTGVLEVCPAPQGTDALVLRAPADAAPHLAEITRRVRRLFDLDADVDTIVRQLGADPLLASAARRLPGVRVPGCWDRFEVSMRAIVGQQITVVGATRLIGRIAADVGKPLDEPRDGLTHLFPTAAALAEATVDGMPRARAEAIRGFARTVADGRLVLDAAPDLETALDRLRALPGIGDWTANYIAMRALAEPDAFPSGDLVLRKAASDPPPTAAALRSRSEAWRPWRAYAAMLLWRSMADGCPTP